MEPVRERDFTVETAAVEDGQAAGIHENGQSDAEEDVQPKGIVEDAAVESAQEDEPERLEVAPTEEELEAIAAELAETVDRRQRLQQDFDKFQARTEEQRPQWPVRARVPVLEEALTVHDDLARWLDAAPEATFEAMLEGAELVHTGLAGIVGRFDTGVSEAPVVLEVRGQEAVDETADEVGIQVQLARELAQLRSLANAYKAYRRRAKLEQGYEVERARMEVVEVLRAVLSALRDTLDKFGVEEVEDPTDRHEALEGAMHEVFDQYCQALKVFEVGPMETLDGPFDVDRHEAVGRAPKPGAKEGTVIYEARRGYMYGKQVLRYAQVIVAA